MLVSYNWLQSYFKNKLPPPKEVSDTLIFRAFEVESINPQNDDYIFDVKVLPDRAHDCLSVRGIAKELSVHLNKKIKDEKPKQKIKSEKLKNDVSIDILEKELCRRYVGRKIEGITVASSPDWLRVRLESIGQKSINNIVDATNFVMFDLGQPLHAFDADKVSGGIMVRKAKTGEHITTLDGKEVTLDTETLIIADDEGSLAIAGIKGGKKAEITEKTIAIILEAANFSPANIRKTSRRLAIQTDSSKRFENERTPEGLVEIMDAITTLIIEVAGSKETKTGDVVDVYPRQEAPYIVGISTNETNRILGTKLAQNDIAAILTRVGFSYRVVESPTKEILGRAATLIDVPYKFGASVVYDAPRAFDCSSFIAYAFAQAGIQVPRMAVDQYAYSEAVDKSDLQPGDLVFSNTESGKIRYETVEWLKGMKVPLGVDHCGLYVGEGNIIHATRVAGKVVTEKLAQSTQFKNIVGFRRITSESPRFAITISKERLDLRIKEDLAEEIGRAYGYDNIKPKSLLATGKSTSVGKKFFYVNKIRNILTDEDFSEIYTSSFQESGEVAIENPIAGDKGYLRPDLYSWMTKSLELNGRNAPFLGLDIVKVFEIGNIFPNKGSEALTLALGVKGKASQEILKVSLQKFATELGTQELREDIKTEGNGVIAQINLDTVIEKLPSVESYGDTLETRKHEIVYQKISTYPFVLRDIAVFVPPQISETEVLKILKKNAGNLLIREPRLFDMFEKKNKETGEIEKISYAFRLVFQSYEKTLSDEEINVIMDSITKMLNQNAGWQVR